LYENEKVKIAAESNVTPSKLAIPKPVFARLLMLFGGGVGCLIVGVIVSLTLEDMVLFALSAILCVAFVAKGFLLRKKIHKGKVFAVNGVCVSITPKMFGRYRCIELVNTDTGDDARFVLPKKIVFKLGHVYTCYFDHQLKHIEPYNGKSGEEGEKESSFAAEFDLPTNGFLGYENFGLYQEKPVAATAVASAKAKNETVEAATQSDGTVNVEKIEEETNETATN